MDTSKLVVGQRVLLASWSYEREATVSKITESCIEVRLHYSKGPAGAIDFMRFDLNGDAVDSRDINDENMDFDGIPGTPEGGPYAIVDSF